MTLTQLSRFEMKLPGLNCYNKFSIDVKVVPMEHLEWVGGFGMTPARYFNSNKYRFDLFFLARGGRAGVVQRRSCLSYTSDAADE